MHVAKLFDLSGRTALVTGGGRGIGRHIAIGLAEAGADVVVASRKLSNCEEVAGEIEKIGCRAYVMPVDLADPETVDALADRALAEAKRIDILVNNAGVIWGAPTLEFPMKGWDRVFNVNVRALWQLSQRIGVHMRDSGGGSIIHISSISGFRGSEEEKEPAIAYNASKGAVNTLTMDMAVKLARYDIRVNAISPGSFDTSMMDVIRDDPSRLEGYLAQLPMKRAGGEDDIKGAAVFLASDAAQYVTGHNLVVDGGWLVRG